MEKNPTVRQSVRDRMADRIGTCRNTERFNSHVVKLRPVFPALHHVYHVHHVYWTPGYAATIVCDKIHESRLSASRACFRWTHCLRLSETHARLSRNRVSTVCESCLFSMNSLFATVWDSCSFVEELSVDCLRVVPVCQGTDNPFSHNLYSFPGLSSLIKNRCDIFIANLLLLLVGVCTKQTLRVLINEINYQWYTWSITIF